VIAVRVFDSKRWREIGFRAEPGKLIQEAAQDELQAGDLAVITVSVVARQVLTIGDCVRDENGSLAVVCEIVPASELAKLVGTNTSPDLVVANQHVWGGLTLGTTAYREVSIRIDFAALQK
jgi:uncharacterized membrane protein